jgi:cytochrome c oxidase subunit 3
MARDVAWQEHDPRVTMGLKPLGMWLFIAADALTFATFLGVYALCRLREGNWPVPFGGGSILMAVGMTAILISSSIAMARAVEAMRRGDSRAAAKRMYWTMALGTSFLILHSVEWLRMIREEHVTLSSNPWGVPLFGAAFFMLTGLHGAHVLGGVTYIAIVAKANWKSVEDVQACGLYWQFVDAVWLVLFPAVYLWR